ncbi:uncharacterized protein LOC120351913 isoform X2 [Nilaparvata lugens]|uniref:uncharacterized protein LOC120351913 isoform X2 n=1 Tax=Nilaparvata lugens TaxID=108931 RepID=UPI00193E7F3D|nr:uncharacterized protein LOC120351913 isoform X2 [Nilaparvata lugens]
MSAGFICCRCCSRWMGNTCGRRSGLLFNLAGNVLELLMSDARGYELSLYAMNVDLGLAGDVGWSLSAFCGVRRDFSLDVLGGCPYPLRDRVYA